MPGLLPCGQALPDDDDDVIDTGEAPPLEGAEERVDVIHGALLELAARPGRRTRNALTALFRTGAESGLVRAVGARLRDEPPSEQGALYGELRTILFETRSRNELKFAIEIVGVYACAEDAEVFRVLARHDEFTLGAARALAYGADDWVGECLALLPEASDAGATELAALLLHTEDERVCSFLLRRCVSDSHAINLALAWLCEWLDIGLVDDDMRRRARSILDGLTWSFSEPDAPPASPDAGTVECFLELIAEREVTLDGLVAAYELGVALGPAHDVRAKRARKLSRAIVDRPEWRAKLTVALEDDDRDERALGIEAAKCLGIPLRDHIVRGLRRDIHDPWLWYHLVPAAGSDTPSSD